jgi:hypothetical protein
MGVSFGWMCVLGFRVVRRASRCVDTLQIRWWTAGVEPSATSTDEVDPAAARSDQVGCESDQDHGCTSFAVRNGRSVATLRSTSK